MEIQNLTPRSWLKIESINSLPRVRLFCLAFAGAGTSAFNGSLDYSVSAHQMSQWQQYSSLGLEQIEIDGPHFYLQSAITDLTKYIDQQLQC